MNNFIGNMMGMAGQAVGTMKQMGQMANEIEGVLQLIRIYKSGGNPMALMSQMAGNNPQMAQAMQIIQGKSENQLMQKRGLAYDLIMVWVAINVEYSDKSEVNKKYGVNSADFYLDSAIANWIEDPDAVDDKLAAYYHCIVKH